MFSSGPKYQKLRTNLQLVVNRLKLLEKKKTELAIKSRKEIADYLQAGKEERARIRVEHIVREDYLVEGMELIEMYCDLLIARLGLIQTQKELDPGLEEPIASIIWATPRLQSDCAELKVVTEQLTAKYGKEFALSCKSNQLNNVNEKLMHKLSVQAPPKALVEKYLEEIARTYNVPFMPDPAAVEAFDVQTAEGLLIDFNERKNGGGGGGNGGGGGGSAMPALTPQQQQQQQQPQPPPASASAPYGGAPYGGAPYPPHSGPPQPPASSAPPGGYAPPFTMPQGSHGSPYPTPPPAGFHTPGAPPPSALYPPKPPVPQNPPAGAATMPELPDLPDLPSVPGGSFNPGATSAGGEDVNFDDLTRRFEELKKKK